MRAGQFVEYGPADLILHQPTHIYTRELLAAVPEIPSIRSL
jgi:ABC-type dipeptide/oligopeptide/nickel transport system ATPase component